MNEQNNLTEEITNPLPQNPRQSVFLADTREIVNTTLKRAKDIRFAADIELAQKNKDNYFALERMDSSIPDDTRGMLGQAYKAVKSTGVNMAQVLLLFSKGTYEEVKRTWAQANENMLTSQKAAFDIQAAKYNSATEEETTQIAQQFSRENEALNRRYENLRKLGRNAMDVLQKNHERYMEQAGLVRDDKDGFIFDLFSGGTTLVAALAVSAITRSPAAAAAMFGAYAGRQDYEEALANGADPKRALLIGAAGGTAEGALEGLGLEWLEKIFKGKGILRAGLKGFLTEGAQEGLQQTAEEIIMQNFAGRQKELEDTFEDIAYSALLGGLTGAPVSMIMNFATRQFTGKGVDTKTAETLAKLAVEHAASAPVQEAAHDVLRDATSSLNYTNGDVKQSAQEFAAVAQQAKTPDPAATRAMYNVAERTEENALQAGYDRDSAELLGQLEQSRANSIYNLAGIKPGTQFDLTQIKFEKIETSPQTKQEDLPAGNTAQQWRDYYEQQAAQEQAQAEIDNAEFDRRIAEAGLTEADLLFQENVYENGKANINTPQFKEWFGDSKVVDNQGNPLVVYHGTKANFETFMPSKDGALGQGMYFVVSKEYAQGVGKNVMPVYLSIKKPYIANGPITGNSEEFTNKLKQQGYDGVINPSNGFYVVFNPIQIKSVYNKGTFDVKNPNIYAQETRNTVFTADNFIRQQVAADIDAYQKGKLPIWKEISLGYPSDPLRAVGIPNNELKLKQKTIKKDTQRKHAVKLDTFKNLPDLLADPVLIFKSDTVPGSFVVVLKDTDKKGNRLIAAIDPNSIVEVNYIDSIYGKDNKYWFKTQAEKGNLLYIDEEEALPESSRLYLRGVPYNASSNSITTKNELVKAQNTFLQENLFNIQGNLFESAAELTETQANKEETLQTQDENELAEAANGLFSEEELKSELSPFKPTGTPERIEDFGEKILYARKDLWGKYKEALTSELPSNYKIITLNKYFPEPNYDTAIEKGITVEQLAIVKALRDSIPAKPQYPSRVERWVKGLASAREIANHVLNHPAAPEQIDNILLRLDRNLPLSFVKNRIEFYKELGYPTFTKAKAYNFREYPRVYMYNGVRYEQPVRIFELSRGYRTIYGSPNREDLFAFARKFLSESTATTKAPSQLDIYQKIRTGEIIIGKKIASGKYIDLKGGFERVADARKYLDENKEHLEALLTEKRKVYPVRKEQNDPRIGKEYRPAGTVVTPERFSQEFGFRGVQFGNWVEQNRRAEDLNNAYDALLDMANIIKIPARAVSLDGTLGLAFGARGTSAAKAHYEPDQVVINLTKKYGAGSLGHEWWHALDNYFGRTRSGRSMVTVRPSDFTALRPEMRTAYEEVVRVVSNTILERSKALDQNRVNDYWSTPEEMTARAFETYLIYKAKEQGYSNDYLANVISPQAYQGPKNSYPYPKKEEMPAISAAFDNFFNTLKTAESARGYTLYEEDFSESEADTSFDFGANVQPQPGILGKVSFEIESNRAIIQAAQQANKSTAIHEFFHVWEHDLYRAEKISNEEEFLELVKSLRGIHAQSSDFVFNYLSKTKLLDDTQRGIILEKIRARGGETYIKELAYNDERDAQDTTAQFVRRAFRENFATLAEKYFLNGKAPSAAYKSLFDRFAAWLREIYGALAGVELSPEVQKFFDKLMVRDAKRLDSKLFTGKVEQLKQQVNNIRQGNPSGNFSLDTIKTLISQLDAPAIRMPQQHLLKDLRRYGANYASAARIDKEVLKDKRIPNKNDRHGAFAGDEPARWLIEHGYMAAQSSQSYEDQSELNDKAYALIERALDGEIVYPIGLQQQAEDYQNYKRLIDTVQETWGDPRAAKKTLKEILDLEEKGYRVVEKNDLTALSLRLGELNRLAERLDNKSATTRAKESADKATLDSARKIRQRTIEELEKRQVEGKQEIIKILRGAKTFEQIQEATAKALDFLETSFEQTEEGQQEKRMIDLPNTNWDNVRAKLLRVFHNVSKTVNDDVKEAWSLMGNFVRGDIKFSKYANLSDEQLSQMRRKAEKLIQSVEPKLEASLIRSLESVLRDIGHLTPGDLRKIISRYAKSGLRYKILINHHDMDYLVQKVKKLQEDNYKQFVNQKIHSILNLNLFDRRGNLRKSLVDQQTLDAMQELKRVSRLGPQSAADELAVRMQRFAETPATPTDKIINELLSIQAYDRKDISMQLYKQAYDDIYALRKAGRSARNLQKMITDFRTEQDKSEILAAVKKNKQSGFVKRLYASWIANWESFLDLITDKEIKEKYSMLNLEADTITYTWQRRTEIMDAVKSIYKLGSNHAVQNKMNELKNEKHTFINYALVDDNTDEYHLKRTGEPFQEELSKLQLITAWIYDKNENLSFRLSHQYRAQDIFASLTKEDKKLADYLQKEAEKSYEQINSVFVKERGYDLPKVEHYFPSVTERVESELDFLQAAASMSKNPSFIKARSASSLIQMKLENPFGILFRHIDRAADYHFKAEKLNQIRRTFKSPILKPAIIEKVGEDVYKRMLELIDQFSVTKPRLNYDMDKLGDWLTNNYVKGAIALKPTIAIKQLISSINYAENMPALKWAAGATDAVLHPKETILFMTQGDPYIKARYESGSMNEALARATADAKAITARGKTLRWTDWLTINTRLGDIGAIIFGGKPYVDYLMKEKGMSKKDAFAEFRKATLRSQQANTRSSLSTLQARDMNFLVRGLFAFKNTPSQYVRKIADAISQYQRGEISAAQLGKVVGIYGLFNSWMYSMLTTLGLLAWYNDDDDANEILSDELFFSPFVQMSSCLPVLDMATGAAAEIIKATAFEHRPHLSRPELPIVSDLFTLGQKALKEELSASDWLEMLASAGQITAGLPTKYAKGIYTGSTDIISGENPMRGFLQALGYTENRAKIATNTRE